MWEGEYPKDVWDARVLDPTVYSHTTIRFDRITHPWLKDLAERWARWRLSTGRGIGSAVNGTMAVESFSVFLGAVDSGVRGTADIDRDVLERFLAHLSAHSPGPSAHRNRVGQFNLFLTTIRRLGWASDLPASAQIYPEDYPAKTVLGPRALSEHVMAQLENPDNHRKWTNSHHQLITMILMRCGLRIIDAVTLPLDCIVRDKDGAPYLRYLNHKMKREALVPSPPLSR